MTPIFIAVACMTIMGAEQRQFSGCTYPPPRYVFQSLEECNNYLKTWNMTGLIEGGTRYTTGCMTKDVSNWKAAQ